MSSDVYNSDTFIEPTCSQCTTVASDLNVATYYQSSSGIIGKKRPAYIDIKEQGMGNQDLIVGRDYFCWLYY